MTIKADSSFVNDPEMELLIPETDVSNPEISIVIPALNEELTVGEFVDWCKEGLVKANVDGEILIVDSSSDKTAQIALAHGARVLKTPRRGLGRAYIDSLPFIRGKYVLMGDADLTYDFREIAPFVQKFHEGYEYIMGSRFQGYIEPGSMPFLHQYFGTPITTWVLNLIYSSRFSDIHSGMRGITRDALQRIDLKSQSWEYASEMIIKSIHLGLKTTEIPINFFKDRKGRVSNLKRLGKFTPWYAGWISLRAMFIYGADFFLYKPGIILLAIGALLVFISSFRAFGIFSLHWMLLGLTITILGLQSFFMGILAKVIYDYAGKRTKKWLHAFRYNKSMFFSALLFISGILFTRPLVGDYIRYRFKLPFGIKEEYYLAIIGLLFIIASLINFTFTLLLHALSKKLKIGEK